MPNDLAQGRCRFQAWREQRPGSRRIPQPLWDLAVRLVSRRGISRTATALGLDYYSLKKRAEAAAQQPPSQSPMFVELPAPGVVGKQALFELDNAAGATMRVQLLGYDAADLASHRPTGLTSLPPARRFFRLGPHRIAGILFPGAETGPAPGGAAHPRH